MWFIFCLGTFGVSVLTLTYVQTCVLKKYGWSELRKRPVAEIYWANLSPMEKTLLWLGFVTFYIALVSGIGWKVVTVFGQIVMATMALSVTPNPYGRLGGLIDTLEKVRPFARDNLTPHQEEKTIDDTISSLQSIIYRR